MHHPHQMSLGQFCAYHLREVTFNLDMLGIARTTKLTASSKEKIEDETTEIEQGPSRLVETEFHGGGQDDEPEDEELGGGSWRPECVLSHERLTSILSRQAEIRAAAGPGRRRRRAPGQSSA